MLNQRNTVSDSLKEQILLESDDPKCVITKLASKHGVTANQIYNWRSKKRQELQSPCAFEALDIGSDNFVELVSNDQKELPRLIEIEYIQTELKFPDFTLSFEGKISAQKLHKIIELVSSVC
jgi:transposase-like protein